MLDCMLQWHCGRARLAVQLSPDELPNGRLGIMGPSGMGKSVFMQLLAGWQTPQQGRIQFGSQCWLDTERGINIPPHERPIGGVFQQPLLFPHLTVRDNVLFGQRRQATPTSLRLTLEEVSQGLEITHLLARWPRHLSGGEAQRVALGRALLSHPELLLLDEPLSAVDDALTGSILHWLEERLSQHPIPLLMVSHDQTELEQLQLPIVLLSAEGFQRLDNQP